ncbi:DNA-(apurinic or apyrimidinic site) lyase [Exophiala xenobiotica]|uniref:DNA-(Apurinic or apyrimidinic site) lyase n=1 Tax=Lithohypha guttulata TaxID=1690604 RepID=A0ABR0JUP0_9EURO|nr:DNA-(apurinic or apyrimidinic site) lyase [Lithohypha guttulata]KAK5317583.1 DNA-(apurinic or apyrimidinic site) lyase [Exophiala xenobiotica]
MPPRPRATGEDKALAVRQSSRKRKHVEVKPESIPQPSHHALKQEDVKDSDEGTTGTTTTSKSSNRRRKPKQDAVLDEPSRTDIANDQKEVVLDIVVDSATNVQRAKKAKTNGTVKPTTADDSSSDLSSAPVEEEKLRLKRKPKPKTKEEKVDSSSELSPVPDEEEESKPKKKRKRKTKEEKEAEAMPLAPRTAGLNMFVGAHVSIAKGVENAITNAVHIGGNAMAMFLQSQRKWENPNLKPENRDAFISACSHHSYDAKQHIVPHGSYLVNLAAKDAAQAKKSYDFFLADLQRCEALGIKYYNFHPGATNKEPLPDAIERLAGNLNKALSETSTVVPLLENMAGTESIIGSRFIDLAQIIAKIKPEYLSRIGICIDTCHTFAAGYDLRTPQAFKKTFQELDGAVGLKYLKAMHLNDSKGMFNSHKDLHQNIGTGFLGLRAFHSIMNEPRLTNIPLILETPCERPDPEDSKKTIDDKTVWSREIKLLESLTGMDPESDSYKKLERDLADQGKEERDKMIRWVADKEEKEREKAAKAELKARKKLEKAEKGQQSISGMFGAKGKKKPRTPSESSSLSSASGSGSD